MAAPSATKYHTQKTQNLLPHKVLNIIVGEELLELTVELSCQGLVVSNN